MEYVEEKVIFLSNEAKELRKKIHDIVIHHSDRLTFRSINTLNYNQEIYDSTIKDVSRLGDFYNGQMEKIETRESKTGIKVLNQYFKYCNLVYKNKIFNLNFKLNMNSAKLAFFGLNEIEAKYGPEIARLVISKLQPERYILKFYNNSIAINGISDRDLDIIIQDINKKFNKNAYMSTISGNINFKNN